jgi:branched chain amino acid efflux pump
VTVEPLTAWALTAGLAVVAFVARAVFILPAWRLRLPPTIERLLRFAPAAALMAIILPDMARSGETLWLSPENPRVVAGLVAFGVAAATRNIVLTIALGLIVLTVMKAM